MLRHSPSSQPRESHLLRLTLCSSPTSTDPSLPAVASASHPPITPFLSSLPTHVLAPCACSLLCPKDAQDKRLTEVSVNTKADTGCQVLRTTSACYRVLAPPSTSHPTLYPQTSPAMGWALLPFPQLLLFYITWPFCPCLLSWSSWPLSSLFSSFISLLS